MPYKMIKKGNKVAVVKKDSGKNMGVSDSEKKAKEHIAAIYANTKGK